jgi:putative membrane protein insertion efficiency factor
MKQIWSYLFIVLFAWKMATNASAEKWGPWSSNDKVPVVGRKDSSYAQNAQKNSSAENPLSRFLISSVRFFQKRISPVDGDRCSMAPTCSHYSLQAIQKHGPFLGFMMSADRIVHEYEEQRFVPAIWDGRSYRFYDPVENNDFWFLPPQGSDLPGVEKAGK